MEAVEATAQAIRYLTWIGNLDVDGGNASSARIPFGIFIIRSIEAIGIKRNAFRPHRALND
jgi:hypothetical protein